MSELPCLNFKREPCHHHFAKGIKETPRPKDFGHRRYLPNNWKIGDLRQEIFTKLLNFSERVWVDVDSLEFEIYLDEIYCLINFSKQRLHRSVRYLNCCHTIWIGEIPDIFEHIINDKFKTNLDSRNLNKRLDDPYFSPRSTSVKIPRILSVQSESDFVDELNSCKSAQGEATTAPSIFKDSESAEEEIWDEHVS